MKHFPRMELKGCWDTKRHLYQHRLSTDATTHAPHTASLGTNTALLCPALPYPPTPHARVAGVADVVRQPQPQPVPLPVTLKPRPDVFPRYSCHLVVAGARADVAVWRRWRGRMITLILFRSGDSQMLHINPLVHGLTSLEFLFFRNRNVYDARARSYRPQQTDIIL
ncbi:hypothetical protein Pmani_030858 [Petrolisthes manimaculis]|uniref:Uncharacterized protein n=1 Tax=Petrolisthes manimaculis TaxID=1843537 RepID=A0AAE1NUS7_9EUCA|nr:hypothetical protein Pmani_030858 [Petrolisthes manimaculis]